MTIVLVCDSILCECKCKLVCKIILSSCPVMITKEHTDNMHQFVIVVKFIEESRLKKSLRFCFCVLRNIEWSKYQQKNIELSLYPILELFRLRAI